MLFVLLIFALAFGFRGAFEYRLFQFIVGFGKRWGMLFTKQTLGRVLRLEESSSISGTFYRCIWLVGLDWIIPDFGKFLILEKT